MKLSIAISLLVFAPAALAYTPSNFRPSTPQTSSPSALGYIEDSSVQDAVDMTFIAKEDPIITALATQLGVTDNSLRDVYGEWLNKYEKTPIEARYAIFKKNFLVQEAWNRENGQSFTLNEYGDNTEEEFMQAKADAVAPVVLESLPIFQRAAPLMEEPTVEIVDKTDKQLELKYSAIESVEERAFEVLKDMGLVKSAPQHFTVSYLNDVPNLNLENGKTYMDALANPDMALSGAGSMTSYLDSMTASESSVLAAGKTSSTTNYLDEICDMMEPFLDCDGPSAKTPDYMQQKLAAVKGLGDRCFQVLMDLCKVGRCDKE